MTSSEVLALKYRPLTFGDLVGQNHVKPILKAIVSSGSVPPALTFSGTRGTGKTTSARIFAAALNCLDESLDADACGTCAQCKAVQNGNSASVLEIDAASNGGVDEVRKIRDECLYTHSGNWRVVIIDEAHSMSKEAYNALLKLMEEPPPNTVILLVTTEPDKILGTVRSRSMPFEFRRIKAQDVVDRLRFLADSEQIPAEEEMLLAITHMAQGGLRDAIMIFDQVSRVGVQTADGFNEFFGIQDYSVPLMWSALRGDYAEGNRLITEHFSRTGEAAGMVANLSRLISDLLVIKSEGMPQGHVEAALVERVEMSQAVDTEALVRVCEVLWDLRSRTRATENDQRSSMEMAFVLIADTVKGSAIEEAVQPILVKTPVMTLQEMLNQAG